jgi:hypothetical protein
MFNGFDGGGAPVRNGFIPIVTRSGSRSFYVFRSGRRVTSTVIGIVVLNCLAGRWRFRFAR